MLKAEINIGQVKITKNQQKKHYSQFSKKELELLENRISKLDVNYIWGSVHLKEKRTITYNPQDIRNVIKNHKIIEYNTTKRKDESIDKRVVLRGRDTVETDRGTMNLCIVLSLKNSAIVTAYYNSALEDTHKNLNLNRYDENLKIVV